MNKSIDWSEWILQKNNEARQEELKKSDSVDLNKGAAPAMALPPEGESLDKAKILSFPEGKTIADLGQPTATTPPRGKLKQVPKGAPSSTLSYPNAEEEMAEKAFLQAHESKNYQAAEFAAGSRAFSKRLFDKYIDHPELSWYLPYSGHFNSWIDRVGFDKAMSHPSRNVQMGATHHRDFKNWFNSLDIDKAMRHPNPVVQQFAVYYHPNFNSWVSRVGFDEALSHHSGYVQEAATRHPDFHNWVRNLGKDRAMKHPDFLVRKAARQVFSA